LHEIVRQTPGKAQTRYNWPPWHKKLGKNLNMHSFVYFFMDEVQARVLCSTLQKKHEYKKNLVIKITTEINHAKHKT